MTSTDQPTCEEAFLRTWHRTDEADAKLAAAYKEMARLRAIIRDLERELGRRPFQIEEPK